MRLELVAEMRHHTKMEVIVDYPTEEGPPLYRYQPLNGEGAWTYVTTRQNISGVPMSVPYSRVIEAIFYGAVSTFDYESGNAARSPLSDFDYDRDYKAAVAFAERTPIAEWGDRDFYFEVYRNKRGLAFVSTQIRTSVARNDTYSVWLTHTLEMKFKDGHRVRSEMKSIEDARSFGFSLLYRFDAADGRFQLFPRKEEPDTCLAYGFTRLNFGQLPEPLRKAMA